VWSAHPTMAQNGLQPFWVGHLSHSVPPVVPALSFYTVPCPRERATASSLADETIFPRPSTTSVWAPWVARWGWQIGGVQGWSCGHGQVLTQKNLLYKNLWNMRETSISNLCKSTPPAGASLGGMASKAAPDQHEIARPWLNHPDGKWSPRPQIPFDCPVRPGWDGCVDTMGGTYQTWQIHGSCYRKTMMNP